MKKLLITLTAGLLFLMPNISYGQAPDLGSAANFVLFSSTGSVTNVGASQFTGNVGTDSGTVTGFGNIDGMMHVMDTQATLCAAALLAAYNQLDTTTPTGFPSSTTIGNGDTFLHGVYKIFAGATLDSTLTLDAGGDPNAVFIFQVQGSFTTGTFAKVKLINRAMACNVFWKIEGNVTLGTGTNMKGNIIANNGSITMLGLDTLDGRALSTAGTLSTIQVYLTMPLGCSIPVLTGPVPPALVSTRCYALFSANGNVSNSGTTFVTGDVGTNAGTTTGFSSADVNGTIHTIPDGSTSTCALDLHSVFVYMDSLPYDIQLQYPLLLGFNLVLTPHTYLLNSATTFTDTLFLNAEGDSNAIFAFRINGNFITNISSRVILMNGAKSDNVYWLINGSVIINDSSFFNGTVVSNDGDILIYTGTKLYGRALTTTGAVTTVAFTVTAHTLPSAGVITGDSSVCISSSITLSDIDTGGVWSSTNARASITSGGIVTGVSAGRDTIRYIVTNSCGSDTATFIITVNPLPNAGTITGASGVCVGSTITLSDGITGGTWSSTNARVTVSGGVVSGITAGTDTIRYMVTNGCGTDTATKIITVNPLPFAGTISGPASVCVGASITLTDGSAGGAWMSSNFSATVFGGIVTGVSAGTDTIMLVASNVCGADTARKIITINPLPDSGSISGASFVCVGSTITLTETATGGTWSASNATASVSGGIVTGITVGIDTIKYSVTNICRTGVATKIVTVNPLPNAGSISGASAVCIGSSITLTDAATGGTWSRSNAKATVSGSGVVTGIAKGIDTIRYTVSNVCGVNIATKIITVDTILNAGSITGVSSVCAGSAITLTDTTAGGTWNRSNTRAAVSGSGIVTGVSAGIDTIRYIVGNSCGNDTAAAVITVNPLPNAGVIIGAPGVCRGTTISLVDDTTGGIWSSSNTNATISGSGLITGITAGKDTIMYAVTNICGTDTARKIISIDTFITAVGITGFSSVCIGSNITLSNAVSGGIWSSANAKATVSASGVVRGISAGIDTIRYIVTNACNSDTASKEIVINPLPNAGTIVGASGVCLGSSITLTDAATGGTWSSTNTNATVTDSGVVTGIAAGRDTIRYTVTNSCGIRRATKILSIDTPRNASVITGASSVCAGVSITLTDSVTGGTWHASNAKATISGSGVVTGVSAGTDTITYRIANACNADTVTDVITINPQPNAGTITGASGICVGSSVTLVAGSGGGIWSSSNADATVSGSGVVTGFVAGIDTIRYAVTNICGTDTSIKIVTIDTFPGAGVIVGPSAVCLSSSITLTDLATGGVWSRSNTNASVSGSGIVTGISAGKDTIRYIVTNSCGTAVATKIISIDTIMHAGSITGLSSVCVGSSITLTDVAPGGFWTESNTTAFVPGAGMVTGVSGGTDTILYIVITACNSDTARKIITINPLANAGIISGPSGVCLGSSITLVDGVAGGTWSRSNTRATVSGTGVVTGNIVGLDTIRYSVSNTCGFDTAIKIISIDTVMTAGSISGLSSVCAGATITLTDAAPGGTWSSSNNHAATSVSGVVNGISAGVDTIRYIVTTACNSDTATKIITVNPLPVSGIIFGASGVCLGSTITLTEDVTGGVWSRTNANATGVDSIVHGAIVGLDTIRYVITNICGADTATKIVSIDTFRHAGTIVGTANVCVGSVATLSDIVAGGVWSSSNGFAAISGSGIVTGVSAGTDTVTYIVTNACGADTATKIVTVNPLPNAGTITGIASVCVGAATTLTDAIPGGTWNTLFTNATVTGGVVTGITAGIDTIIYTVGNICGVDTASRGITILPLPNPGIITGHPFVCFGESNTFTDSVSGGIWSSSNTTATISDSGVVTWGMPGTDTIMYSVSNLCGIATTIKIITVFPLPVSTIITGDSSVCPGSVITLADIVAGGAWSATNTNATITDSGVVTGFVTGTDTILYIVSSICSTDTSLKIITINPLPYAGSIIDASIVCAGSSVTFVDIVTGGVWSASNSTASVSGGIVTGNTAGVDTIMYAVTNECGTQVASAVITINPLPFAGIIMGDSLLCIGTTITYTDDTTGGTWGTSNAMDTITSGVFIASIPGIDTISYSVSNICGTNTAIKAITIDSFPVAGSITGVSGVCVGSTITLTDNSAGGAWSSSNNTVIITDSIITGAAAGTDTILYIVVNVCSADTAIKVITIDPLPFAGTITGPSNVCIGTTITLTDSVTGGTWVNNHSLDSLSGGVVLGVAPGTDTILYLVSNVCGTDSAKAIVTINPSADTSHIYGASTVCIGATITLMESGTGGTWSAYNTKASVSSGGVVSGITVGIDTIAYTIENTCGFYIVTKSINIGSFPSVPSIVTVTPASVCSGTMYQNFSASPAASGSLVYSWTAINAQVWATGNDGNNALVNFPDTGRAWVILSSNITGTLCPSRDTFITNVSATPAQTPYILYFEYSFICLPNSEGSYQWGYDAVGTLVPTTLTGEVNQDYYAPSPDLTNKYYWVMTTNNGCIQKTYYNTPTAIQNINTGITTMDIAPNPANEFINVSINTSIRGDLQLEVVNMTGQKLSMTRAIDEKATIDVAGIPAGVYIINCYRDDIKIASSRFIKN